MNELKIDEELKNLIPPLKDDEFKQLEANCLEEGIREKILTWNGFIIDGHNRFEIANKWDLDYETESKSFKTDYDVRVWMIENQMGRRNLNNRQLSGLRAERYELEKKEIGAQKGEDHHSNSKGSQCAPLKTAEKIADEFSVSETTIKKDVKLKKSLDIIAENLGDDTKQDIQQKKIKITDQEINQIAKLDPEEQEKVFEIANSGVKYKSLTSVIKDVSKEKVLNERKDKILTLDNSTDIYNDSCLNVLNTLKDNSIDCVVTDPPYAIDFNHSWQGTTIQNDDTETALKLLDDACLLLTKKCKENAHIYIFSGWLMIDKFKQIIEKHFDISNILVWVKNNTSLVDFNKRYAFKYENIFFCKQKGNNERLLINKQSPDVLNFKRVAVPQHPTEKPVELLEYLIKNSTVKNETVLDTFMGSGSTGVACLNLERSFIGVELDKKHFDYAKQQLAR